MHTNNQNIPKKTKYKTVTQKAKEAKNDPDQLKTKLTVRISVSTDLQNFSFGLF